MSQLLLQDLLLYDGSGCTAPFRADLLLEGDTVLQVEKASSTVFPGAVKRSFPAGCSVSPGWIDVHAHSDGSILADPNAYSKVTQGITCEISGNCGLSAFPLYTGEVREHLKELYKVFDLKMDWTDFRSYADKVDQAAPAINQVYLCGHNTLRANAAGYGNPPVTEQILTRMKEDLNELLRQGAAGFSTGLLYTPGCFSGREELLELLKITAHFQKVHATHLRSEGNFLLEAVNEMLDYSRVSGCALQISHIKTAGERNWHKLPELLCLIRQARENGLKVHADRYPYTFSQTSLSIVLDEPFDKMDDRSIRNFLRQDQQLYERTLLRLRHVRRNWNNVILTATGAEGYTHLTGQSIRSAADACAMEPEQLVMLLLREDSPGTMAAFGGLSGENLKTLLQQDYLCCGSDETARPADYSLGKSHPRGFGSMIRFIRMCRDLSIPMAEIIRRITLLPATVYSLPQRGLIAPGMKADLTIFQEELLQDHADFQTPHAPCSGITELYINGIPHSSGIRSGKVIKVQG